MSWQNGARVLDVPSIDGWFACVLLSEAGGRYEEGEGGGSRRRRPGSASWWLGCGSTACRVVGMESTGGLLDGRSIAGNWRAPAGFELIVANAQHIKAVPGRKTDMNDARVGGLPGSANGFELRPSFCATQRRSAICAI